MLNWIIRPILAAIAAIREHFRVRRIMRNVKPYTGPWPPSGYNCHSQRPQLGPEQPDSQLPDIAKGIHTASTAAPTTFIDWLKYMARFHSPSPSVGADSKRPDPFSPDREE